MLSLSAARILACSGLGRATRRRASFLAGHPPHTSSQLLDPGFQKVIDTDCSRGGWLTAIDLVHLRFLQANERGELRQVTTSDFM
jgi:hypothetical protein